MAKIMRQTVTYTTRAKPKKPKAPNRPIKKILAEDDVNKTSKTNTRKA